MVEPKAKAKAKATGKRKPEGQGEAFNAAVEAMHEVASGPPGEVKLHNGVVLKVKAVPPLLIRKAVAKLVRPTPPVVDIGKGREEENVNDPDYQAALQEYGQKTFDAGANVMLALGTKVKSVPKDVDKPESDDWLEVLKAAGIDDIDVDTPIARYLSWLSFYAITSEQDLIRIVMGVSRMSGIGETEVAEAVQSFRGRKARAADNGSSSKTT